VRSIGYAYCLHALEYDVALLYAMYDVHRHTVTHTTTLRPAVLTRQSVANFILLCPHPKVTGQ